MGELQRREFHQALFEASSFEDLPGEWQAAVLEAEQNRRPKCGHRQQVARDPVWWRAGAGQPRSSRSLHNARRVSGRSSQPLLGASDTTNA